MTSPTARAGAVLGALLGGHTVLEIARDALFLQRLPPSRLAAAYAAMAVIATVTVPAASALVRRLGRRGALRVTLGLAASGTLGFAAAPASAAATLALHLWTGAAATVLSVQFWLLAGELFPGAAGRRAFAPIAVAGALGAFAGAALAGLAIPTLGAAGLLPVAAAWYVAAAWALAACRPAPAPSEPERPASGRWRGRRYLRRLASIVALSTAALLVADYLFKVTLARSMTPAEVPVFVGRYHAVVTALSLVMQVVGVGWVVRRRRRLVVSLTVLPAVLLAGAAAAIALPAALIGVVIAKGADGVLRHSLHRVSLEVLWTPLPADLRAHAKQPIDGVLVRATQAVTAGGLLLLGTTHLVLALLVFAIAGVWLVAALGMRRPVLESMGASCAELPIAR